MTMPAESTAAEFMYKLMKFSLSNVQEKDGISCMKSANIRPKDAECRKNYVEDLKTRKNSSDERMCILARINADKEERRLKEQYRISARPPHVSVSAEDSGSQQSIKNICLLNIRLLNGSSIQAKHFTINNTLKDVRLWIDEVLDRISLFFIYNIRIVQII